MLVVFSECVPEYYWEESMKETNAFWLNIIFTLYKTFLEQSILLQ